MMRSIIPAGRLAGLLSGLFTCVTACSADVPTYCGPYEDRLASISAGFGPEPALGARLRATGYELFVKDERNENGMLVVCLYEKAVSLGDAEAAYLLVPLYFTGVRGLGQDPQRASR